MQIAKELERQDSEIEIRFVSYGTGAKTIEDAGGPLIFLDLPENGSTNDMSVKVSRLIRWLKPDLVVSHEEFAAIPVAKTFKKPTIFITDWFEDDSNVWMDQLRYAAELGFSEATNFHKFFIQHTGNRPIEFGLKHREQI